MKTGEWRWLAENYAGRVGGGGGVKIRVRDKYLGQSSLKVK